MENEKKYCQNCGAEMEEDEDVCINCGAVVQSQEEIDFINAQIRKRRIKIAVVCIFAAFILIFGGVRIYSKAHPKKVRHEITQTDKSKATPKNSANKKSDDENKTESDKDDTENKDANGQNANGQNANGRDTEGVNTNGNAENPTAESIAGEYIKGTLSQTSYTNAFCGINVSVPDGWIMLSEDEVNSKFNNTQSSDGGYEMAMYNPSSGSQLSLFVKKMQNASMTMEQYMEELINQMTGNAFNLNDNSVKTIAGAEYNEIKFSADNNGKVIFCDLYLRKIDDRIMGMMSSYLQGNESDAETTINSINGI